jgi:hypothetical protein
VAPLLFFAPLNVCFSRRNNSEERERERENITTTSQGAFIQLLVAEFTTHTDDNLTLKEVFFPVNPFRLCMKFSNVRFML